MQTQTWDSRRTSRETTATRWVQPQHNLQTCCSTLIHWPTFQGKIKRGIVVCKKRTTHELLVRDWRESERKCLLEGGWVTFGRVMWSMSGHPAVRSFRKLQARFHCQGFLRNLVFNRLTCTAVFASFSVTRLLCFDSVLCVRCRSDVLCRLLSCRKIMKAAQVRQTLRPGGVNLFFCLHRLVTPSKTLSKHTESQGGWKSFLHAGINFGRRRDCRDSVSLPSHFTCSQILHFHSTVKFWNELQSVKNQCSKIVQKFLKFVFTSIFAFLERKHS